MPNQTTPDHGNSVDDVLRLSRLLRPSWAAVSARIPSWHPRCETPDPNAAPEPPSIDWDSAENPYRQRYTDTQSAYTRSQQELAAERAAWDDDEALVGRLREKRPHWLSDPEPPDPDLDPRVDQLQQELAEQRQWRDQVETERQAQRVEAGEKQFNTDLDGWATEAGLKLSKWDRMAILQETLAAEEPGPDAAKAAFDAFAKDAEQTRPRPRVPTPPTGGVTATGTPNFSEMSEADINEWMAQRAAGNV